MVKYRSHHDGESQQLPRGWTAVSEQNSWPGPVACHLLVPTALWYHYSHWERAWLVQEVGQPTWLTVSQVLTWYLCSSLKRWPLDKCLWIRCCFCNALCIQTKVRSAGSFLSQTSARLLRLHVSYFWSVCFRQSLRAFEKHWEESFFPAAWRSKKWDVTSQTVGSMGGSWNKGFRF